MLDVSYIPGASLLELEASVTMCPEVIESLQRCPRLRSLHCDVTKPNAQLLDFHLVSLRLFDVHWEGGHMYAFFHQCVRGNL